ncbi:glycine-rich protein, putative [Trichomonas vaginalis G3]|uniref:receptor protein-tyrosine kinase n=1 Tax=Trichomonas vaginalis (strain ATCC PRA-98 / G3) TaxID=412133 RepID=A2FPA8_TRIV3|nr:glycine-rich protein family [Trichomonas vaginalis G3]EAX93256.1 glycine-rich protein, putative [Trichomonas vaginalis G3]KAI5496358.1 glycine-rich protein family [Trichomonas vaginalis G3]|eukprot:XP_001306186.1 glycine-rich protein [Trichomonas vaginalis G3]
MVSGGGGSAEWEASIGGHGGGLVGASGVSDCTHGYVCPDIISTGGTQTFGGIASKIGRFGGLDGRFGIVSLHKTSSDHGGLGGNGYWSGATLNYAGAGGGGSSFVSGFPNCIALNSSENENPSETNSSVHYSGISFMSPSMQQGNTTMPLYYKRNSIGIGNRSRGAIRITILNYIPSCKNSFYSFKTSNMFVFILINET